MDIQSKSGIYSYRQNAYTISVFSLRGGVGKSTIAVNLAAALASLWQLKIGLVDLALETGHCSLMLDLKPRATLASLSDWREPVTADVVAELTVEHPSGVVLLPGADSPSEGELVRPEFINLVWPILASRFPLIVVDAGSQMNEVSLSVLDRSDFILLVFAPDLASVKSTTDSLQLFNEFGYPSEKVLPVANWIFPSNPVLLNRIVTTLKVSIAGEIPFDSQAFVQAINTGKPPVLSSPDGRLAEVFFKLAYQLSSGIMESHGVSFDTPALRKIHAAAAKTDSTPPGRG